MVHTETRRGGAHRDAVNSLTKTRLTRSTGAHSDVEMWSTRGAHRDADGALAETQNTRGACTDAEHSRYTHRRGELMVHTETRRRGALAVHTDAVNSRCTQRRGDVEHSQCTQTR